MPYAIVKHKAFYDNKKLFNILRLEYPLSQLRSPLNFKLL
jgi:hypothetical protein